MKTYTTENKQRIVSEVQALINGGKTIARAVKQVGISAITYQTWRKQLGNDSKLAPGDRISKNDLNSFNTVTPLFLVMGSADQLAQFVHSRAQQ